MTPRLGSAARAAGFAAALVVAAGSLACRTTSDDIHRWARTEQGPRKLVAVLEHDKFDMTLRLEAALALATMPPRRGQRIGVDLLVEGLADLPGKTRAELAKYFVPLLDKGMRQAPVMSGKERSDPAVPYKDSAFALLTSERAALIEDPALREVLATGLIHWATTDFSARLADSAQKYGMEQVLRYLGARGVRDLAELIPNQQSNFGRIADLIAELGDPPTKTRAAEHLVAIATKVDSQAWLDTTAPALRKANESSGLKDVDAKRFQQQLVDYQGEELQRVFLALKKVGQKPTVDYLLRYASNPAADEKRRTIALAALEGHIDKHDDQQVQSLITLASAKDTPDSVRDIALRRVGELPRKQVAKKLYALFPNDNWKIRWVAAELLLKMSDGSQVGEFMQHLGPVKNLALTEPLRYGELLGTLSGKPTPRENALRFLGTDNKVPARLTALGYFYKYGTAADLPEVERYAGDKGKIDRCEKDAKDCEWQCFVGEGKDNHAEPVESVGDYVTHCIKPAMVQRKAGSVPQNAEASGKK